MFLYYSIYFLNLQSVVYFLLSSYTIDCILEGVMSELSVAFGRCVRLLRKTKKYSQEQLAELSDISPVYIGCIERGEKNASLETLFKISQAFGVSLSELFSDFEGELRISGQYPTSLLSRLDSLSPAQRETFFSAMEELLSLILP